MLMTGLLKVIALLFFASIWSLVLGSEIMADELLKEPESYLEKLVKSTSSLDWITRLFQQKALLYSKLRFDYNRALAKLNVCKTRNNFKKCITEVANELFNLVIKSDSMADKVKALQALHPFLNDKTAKHLIKTYSTSLQDLSTITQCLAESNGIKIVDMDANNARVLLNTKNEYYMKDVLSINSSCWFLITQMEEYPHSLNKFYQNRCMIINGILKNRLVLRADIDLELLFKSIDKDFVHSNDNDMVFRWYRYFIEKSPFANVQLYDTQDGWELASKELLLEDPKITTNTLDEALLFNVEGKRNYLLLLYENPMEKLMELKLVSLDEIYSCFAIGFNIKSSRYHENGLFYKISKEKHAELASYFVELQNQDMLSCDFITVQQILPYLQIASLFKKDEYLDSNYARRFTQNFMTLELLDVIEKVPIKIVYFAALNFNEYLLENPNWNDAVEKHFHYYISAMLRRDYPGSARNLAEYFGIFPEMNYMTLSIIGHSNLGWVNCTLDKIPRHLNSFFEIAEKSTQEERDFTRLDVAIFGGIFNRETVDIAHMEDFVYYALKAEEIRSDLEDGPIFVDFARIYYKDKSRDLNRILQFLLFEHSTRNYFPSLTRMDLEEGFQKLSNKDSFSVTLMSFIFERFYYARSKLVLRNLEMLKKELLKYSPEITIGLRLEKTPIKILLKAIYETLGNPCTDLGSVLARHLSTAQLLDAGLV